MKHLAGLLAAATLLATQPVRADEGDETAATELFNAGRDAMKRGDYAVACPKLAESVRLVPTVGALAKLAACEEHQHHLVSAYTRWQQALNLARTTRDDRLADVESELARVDKLVPKLVITAAAGAPADESIRVDETTMSAAASLGVTLPVEPGRHTVQASAAGKKTWTTMLDVEAGATPTSVVIPQLEDAPAPTPPPTLTPAPAPAPDLAHAPPSAPAPTSTAPPRGPWRTVGLIAGGVGLAAIAGGAAFGIDALRKRDDAHCPANACPDAAAAASLQSAKTSANWSSALFATGAALVAGGVVLWVFVGANHAAVGGTWGGP